jgi:hypothetical protein
MTTQLESRPLRLRLKFDSPTQGCQMAYFLTKNPKLGKFWRALEWIRLEYYMALLNILRYIGNLVYCRPIRQFSGKMVYFHPFWYIV